MAISHFHILKSEITYQRIAWQLLVEKVTEELTSLPGWERFTVVTQVPSEVAYYGDSYRLAVIFKNMLSNAVLYQDAGRSQPQLTITIQVTEQAARILFDDNGVGIEPNNLDRIFMMFSRFNR